MKLKQIASALALVSLGLAANASASVIPSGVLNDVSLDTVTQTWGWTLISESNYGGGLSIADLFAGHKDYVMIGAMRKDSGVIDVLARLTISYFLSPSDHVDLGDEASARRFLAPVLRAFQPALQSTV